MNQLLFPLVPLLSELLKPKYDARMAMLKYQNLMLRDPIDASRIVPTPDEHSRDPGHINLSIAFQHR
jgi:hypothetical protein